MLLTIRTTHQPAEDLGYLLHKHPGRSQSFDLAFGRAHVFYPELTPEACTAALLLEIDPVRLVRGGPSAQADGLLSQYVNDRPYVASSFLSVAIAQVLRSALAGISKDRPALVDAAIPLTARLPCVPCRGGELLLRRLFEPLGYTVNATRLPLDAMEPNWGMSPYYDVELVREGPLRELLAHLYVLIPVLDDEKHYYIGDEEVDKLLRVGEGWLSTHPERETIASRYLKHRMGLTRMALARLSQGESDPELDDVVVVTHDRAEEGLERAMSLNDERLHTIVELLRSAEVSTVLDL
ncbi:MAG TPA: 3' terminal RNA ribose 2'-O-methyltransferase Hen1, partial [Nannocystis sp.]